MATGVVKQLWANENRRCVLTADGDWVELRLYQRGHLVGLCVCPSVERALDLAIVWYDHPPTWPPLRGKGRNEGTRQSSVSQTPAPALLAASWTRKPSVLTRTISR